MMRYLVFDLETFAVQGICPPTLKYKLEKKATTKKDGLNQDKLDMYYALNPLSSIIVSISTAAVTLVKNDGDHIPTITIHQVGATTLRDFFPPSHTPTEADYPEYERALINQFLQTLDKDAMNTILVGYNSDEFDIPFLRYRIMSHRLDAGYGRKYFRPRPYDSTMDLMKIVHPYRSPQQLKTTAQSLFPAMYANRTLDSGSDVRKHVLSGDWESLRKYSALDAQMTAQILKSYLIITM